MQRIAPRARSTVLRQMFVRDLVLQASIGVHPHEYNACQRVRINLDLAITDKAGGSDDLASVVDYEALIIRARHIVTTGHVKLVESLAERLALACLDDTRVVSARVRVEKLDVFADAAASGVEIERFNIRPSCFPTTIMGTKLYRLIQGFFISLKEIV